MRKYTVRFSSLFNTNTWGVGCLSQRRFSPNHSKSALRRNQGNERLVTNEPCPPFELRSTPLPSRTPTRSFNRGFDGCLGTKGKDCPSRIQMEGTLCCGSGSSAPSTPAFPAIAFSLRRKCPSGLPFLWKHSIPGMGTPLPHSVFDLPNQLRRNRMGHLMVDTRRRQ